MRFAVMKDDFFMPGIGKRCIWLALKHLFFRESENTATLQIGFYDLHFAACGSEISLVAIPHSFPPSSHCRVTPLKASMIRSVARRAKRRDAQAATCALL